MTQQKEIQINNETSLPAVMLRMITGLWGTQIIHVAAKLGIADLLNDGPKNSAELAKSTGVNAGALYRLLRALASLGIFAERDTGFFEMTPLAEYLRTGVPGSLRAAAIMWGEDWHYRPWGNLLHSVKTGQTGFSHVFGEEIFTYLARNREAAKVFNVALSDAAFTDNAAIAAAYDFSRAGCVVDVGGGHGSLIAAILKAYPAAQGILFDQPSVVAGAEKLLEAEGVASRCEIAGGDFFESVSPGGDVYMLKYVVHDWDDDRALKILRSLHRAMRAKSRILLIENLIRPGNEPSFGKLMDITMLVMAAGRERTIREYRALYAAAGFELTNIIPTQSTLSLIEGVKP